MRSLLIGCVVAGLVAAVPVSADAHWRHHHRVWRHVWHAGVSYYPFYGFYAGDPFGPVCVWNRNWDGYWHRDCF